MNRAPVGSLSPLPLSVVLIVKNEAENLERCLSSVVGWCGELVVLDSGSSDNTAEIAKRFTQKVFNSDWMGYTEQRNKALSHAQFDWVLSIDADEVVSGELRNEIETLFNEGKLNEFTAYRVPRKTFQGQRWLRYGGWYPNRLIRLMNRRCGKWVGDQLHEKWESSGQTADLQFPLLHYSFVDFADQVSRNNHYSTLGSRQLSRSQIQFSYFRFIAKPLGKFLETYVWKRGFLDGFVGFFVSVSAAYSVFLKWAKLWEMEQSEKKN